MAVKNNGALTQSSTFAIVRLPDTFHIYTIKSRSTQLILACAFLFLDEIQIEKNKLKTGQTVE